MKKGMVERACIDCGVKRMVDVHHMPDRCKFCMIKHNAIHLDKRTHYVSGGDRER